MVNKILRLPLVKKYTGLCGSSICSRIAGGTFPKQINLGSRAVGWLEADINDWIESRKQSRNEVD